MTITYNKEVGSLTCYADIDGKSDVVFIINWYLIGVEGNLSASNFYSISVPYEAGQPFTPYADLTEAQVLQWIEEYTPTEVMESYYQSIADKIEEQKVIFTPPLPWQITP